MASSNDYLVYVLDICREVNGLHYKKMMGEYLLYSGPTLFGGIYDNRFLIKATSSTKALGLREAIPYPGAKPMLVLDSENPREIAEIVELLVKEL